MLCISHKANRLVSEHCPVSYVQINEFPNGFPDKNIQEANISVYIHTNKELFGSYFVIPDSTMKNVN